VDLDAVLVRRRMVRAFSAEPIPAELIDDLLDRARLAPSAGNTQATRFLVLDSPETVAAYWDVTLPEPGRSSFRWQRLLDAPVLVLVTTRPAAYPERYARPDKAATGRGGSVDDWPVPYWWVDAGAVVQNLLLLAVDRDLGACLFGPFDHEPALAAAFGVDDDTRLVATVAIGHPLPDEPGRSAGRPRPPRHDVIVRPGAPRNDGTG
jgi:nitroreductase